MKNLLLILVITLLLLSCSEESSDLFKEVDMEDLDISDDFSFRTSQDVNVNISVFTRDNDPVDGIHFAVYKGDPTENDNLLAQGATFTGIFSQKVIVPTYIDSLTIIGFMTTMTLPISNNAVTYQFGGAVDRGRSGGSNFPRDDDFVYLTAFDENGVPEGLQYDLVSGDFLARVNASLPENLPVPTYHPDYLLEGSVLNIILEENANVYVTFVHEGAWYKNSLGFYTYNINDGPPETPDSLIHTIIFPNASLYYGGGGLAPGDKLYLGEFPEGTVIGWFLVTKGWTGSGVNPDRTRYYSNSEYNPEHANHPEYHQHTVLLYDDQEDKILLAFEDLHRPYGDNDFNDAVFYVTADPVEAVNTENINPMDIEEDDDADGISNIYDDYPDDPARAFDNFYPAENSYGTLGFEDYWPKQGDFDMNDLVVDYNFRNVHDPQNKLFDVEANIILRAIGASYHNGFAIELPFSYSEIESWEGDSWVDVESAGEQAIVRVFEDAYDIIDPPGEGFVNTDLQYPYYDPVTIHFKIYLNSGLNLSNLDYLPPYNPFLRANGNIYKEIHLPDYPPTDLADISYFQTEDDDSNPASGRYYKTVDNLPWAIDITENWNYPIERSQITWGYLVFQFWAESSGSNYQDWFQLIEGTINEDHIYIQP